MKLSLKRPIVLTLSAALLVGALTMLEALAAPTTIRVCKTTTSPNPATGSFTFNVSEVTPTNPVTPVRTVTVPVGGCSVDIAVTAGNIRVSELPQANTALADVTVTGSGAVVSKDLPNRTAIVAIASTSNVTFRNQATPVVNPCTPTTPPVPPASSTPAFVMDMKTGFAGTFGSNGVGGPIPSWVSFKTPLTPLASPNQGWNRAALKIDMKGYCKANIVVEYEGDPTLWTVDIGDSPTNDGYAGDAGSTDNCAEVQIVNNSMAIYSKAIAPGNAPLLGTDTFSLKDGAVKFVVSNGALTWGQPYKSMIDPNLFSIPDSTGKDASFIYASFNSVISQRLDRVGHGARRVTITLQ